MAQANKPAQTASKPAADAQPLMQQTPPRRMSLGSLAVAIPNKPKAEKVARANYVPDAEILEALATFGWTIRSRVAGIGPANLDLVKEPSPDLNVDDTLKGWQIRYMWRTLYSEVGGDNVPFHVCDFADFLTANRHQFAAQKFSKVFEGVRTSVCGSLANGVNRYVVREGEWMQFRTEK
jgi:cellobiose-specific phosphotransferase system component IIB